MWGSRFVAASGVALPFNVVVHALLACSLVSTINSSDQKMEIQ